MKFAPVTALVWVSQGVPEDGTTWSCWPVVTGTSGVGAGAGARPGAGAEAEAGNETVNSRGSCSVGVCTSLLCAGEGGSTEDEEGGNNAPELVSMVLMGGVGYDLEGAADGKTGRAILEFCIQDFCRFPRNWVAVELEEDICTSWPLEDCRQC